MYSPRWCFCNGSKFSTTTAAAAGARFSIFCGPISRSLRRVCRYDWIRGIRARVERRNGKRSGARGRVGDETARRVPGGGGGVSGRRQAGFARRGGGARGERHREHRGDSVL